MIVKCASCDLSFEREAKFIARSQRLGKKLYCTGSCAAAGRHKDRGNNPPKECVCICGNSFKRSSKLIARRTSLGMKGPYCSRRCAISNRSLKKNPKEYRRKRTPDGRNMRVHRYEMEKEIGRRLLPSELVHHKDENKHNNDPSNLEITTRSNHARIHHAR